MQVEYKTFEIIDQYLAICLDTILQNSYKKSYILYDWSNRDMVDDLQ